MKKMFMLISIMLAVAVNLQAAMYYSKPGTPWPTSGTSWNLESDGTGANGFSGTYGFSGNDITIQAGHTMYINNPGESLTWNANTYTMENGAIFESRAADYATFNGGDITVGAGSKFINGTGVGAGNSAGGVTGSANVQLGANTLILDQKFSSSSGVFEFGLNVVGSGTIDFNFANANCDWYLSGLSSDFTGTILGDTFNGALKLAAGDGAINAAVIIGRSELDRACDLDLTGAFSVGSLSIDGVAVDAGTYTYDDLVTFNAGFSDNLIDNGGTVQVVPEPATIGMLGLGALLTLLVRRMKY